VQSKEAERAHYTTENPRLVNVELEQLLISEKLTLMVFTRNLSRSQGSEIKQPMLVAPLVVEEKTVRVS
jgi:hypothetical protein